LLTFQEIPQGSEQGGNGSNNLFCCGSYSGVITPSFPIAVRNSGPCRYLLTDNEDAWRVTLSSPMGQIFLGMRQTGVQFIRCVSKPSSLPHAMEEEHVPVLSQFSPYIPLFVQDKLARVGSYETLIPGNVVVLITRPICIRLFAPYGSAQLKHSAIIHKLY
jgi:hypothetical protein